MGTKEDLVLQRLAEEQCQREERDRQHAEERARREAEHAATVKQLRADIKAESVRIAALLENADWSQAELIKFYGKRSWWRRRRSIELACLRLWPTKRAEMEVWIRSDGLLLFRLHGNDLLQGDPMALGFSSAHRMLAVLRRVTSMKDVHTQ